MSWSLASSSASTINWRILSKTSDPGDDIGVRFVLRADDDHCQYAYDDWRSAKASNSIFTGNGL